MPPIARLPHRHPPESRACRTETTPARPRPLIVFIHSFIIVRWTVFSFLSFTSFDRRSGIVSFWDWGWVRSGLGLGRRGVRKGVLRFVRARRARSYDRNSMRRRERDRGRSPTLFRAYERSGCWDRVDGQRTLATLILMINPFGWGSTDCSDRDHAARP
jgi:hypothetical protein